MLSCQKQDELTSEPAAMRVYGFGVADDHQIFRSGEFLYILQPISIGKWQIRTINVLSMEQGSPSSLDIVNILNNAGVSNTTLIGTSELIQLTNGYALSVLSKSNSTWQLRVIRLNDSFQSITISRVVQGSQPINSIYSAPGICLFENDLFVTYGIKKNDLFEMKTYEYELATLDNNPLGTASIPILQVPMTEGAKMQLTGKDDMLIAHCEMNPPQYLTLNRNNAEVVDIQNQAITDFGVTKHHSMLKFNDLLYAACEKDGFAGLVPLNGGESLGVNNSYNPQLQFAHVTNGQVILSLRSIPPDLSTPDFSSLLVYNANGSSNFSVQPEQIAVRTPKYIYVGAEADDTYTLLGLTPENQAFIIKVDNIGKMISF